MTEPSPHLPSSSGQTSIRTGTDRGFRYPSWLGKSLLWLGISLAIAVPGAAGVFAVRHLLQVADQSDCRASVSLNESYSARIYCADELAKRQTIADLRDAIKLVSTIPADNPLHQSSDRRLERWSQDLMRLAESSFQAGNLDEAINAAQAVPIKSQTYAEAQARIDQWQKTWETAESVYKETIDAIQNQEWSNAMGSARRLLALDNHYWQTTRHQELMDELQAAREQQKTQSKSVAKRPKPEKAFARWDQTFEAEAVEHLRKAKILARSGNVESLRAAIAAARQVYFGTAVYDEAQRQIDTWEAKLSRVEDRHHLDRAIQLATRGDEASLQAGIDAAYQVSPSGKLYDEARSLIDRWTDQLYRLKYPEPDLPPPTLTSGDRTDPATRPRPTSSPLPGTQPDNPLPLSVGYEGVAESRYESGIG